MAFDLDAAGGFGKGKLGSVTNPSGFINSFGSVASFSNNAIAINNISNGIYHDLTDCAGVQILLHAAASKNGSSDLLGRWLVATVLQVEATSASQATLTIDKNLSAFSTAAYSWQVLTLPEFKNLTLSSGALAPPAFSTASYQGGLLAFKVADTLTFAGGHVNLVAKGLPAGASTLLRPLTAQEQNGTLDLDKYAGAENSITKDKLLLNVGDGACFILARTINTKSSSSRIGNSATAGVAYCRGASDSYNTPSGVTNVGGSSLLLACNSWRTFAPNILAKYRSGSLPQGRGLARAYVAVKDSFGEFTPDEGLYALDVISNTRRLKNSCNFFGFGNGQLGAKTYSSINVCLNAYARVSAISGRVFTLSRVYAEKSELVDFSVGRLVMIHQARKASAQDYLDGKFFLSRIAAVNGASVTLAHDLPVFSTANYYVQMIAVPEFSTLKLTCAYQHTPPFSNGAGGICVLCCSDTCNLLSGQINVEGKGTNLNIVNKAVGNYALQTCLPIGQGHGSVLIMAKTLSMNTATRIGATYDGSQFGGQGGAGDKASFASGGGYRGATSTKGASDELNGTGGGGKEAGVNVGALSDHAGGWHSNAGGIKENSAFIGRQGAHVLIIADTISGLNLNAISTGGGGGNVEGDYKPKSGGCGYGGGGKAGWARAYGGGGGYQGGGGGGRYTASEGFGGGGGAGAAFIYCNNCSGQVTTNLILT